MKTYLFGKKYCLFWSSHTRLSPITWKVYLSVRVCACECVWKGVGEEEDADFEHYFIIKNETLY